MASRFHVVLTRFSEDLFSDPLDIEEEVMLAYFAGAGKTQGVSLSVLDFQNNPEYELSEIMNETPDLIAVCVRLPGTNLDNSKKRIEELRKTYNNKVPHVTLIGHTGTVWQDLTIDSPFDSILFGEEKEFANFLDVFARNEELSQIDGLAYKVNNETIVFNKLPDLETTFSLGTPYHYHLEALKLKGKQTKFARATIQTSRGCYAGCEFCFIQAYKKLIPKLTWRPRPDEEILNEIEKLKSDYGIRNFKFFDMEFVGPGQKGRTRAIRLAQRIIERDLHISFLAYIRADHIDDELLLILKKAGLTTIFLGVESFNQNTLNRFNKGTKASTNTHALSLCIKHDVFVHMGFIPFDSKTTMPELLENLKALKDIVGKKPWLFSPTQLIYNPIIPIPHTNFSVGSLQDASCVINDELQNNIFVDERISLTAKIYSDLTKNAKGKQLQVREYLESRIGDNAEKFDEAQFYSALKWFSGLSILLTTILYESAQIMSMSSKPSEDAEKIISRNKELLEDFNSRAGQIILERDNYVHSS